MLFRSPLSTDPLLGKLGGCTLTSCPGLYIIIIIITFYCRFPRKRGLAGVIPITPLHLSPSWTERNGGGSEIFEAGRIPSALRRMPLSTNPLLGKLGGCSLTSCPRTIYIYIYHHILPHFTAVFPRKRGLAGA